MGEVRFNQSTVDAGTDADNKKDPIAAHLVQDLHGMARVESGARTGPV